MNFSRICLFFDIVGGTSTRINKDILLIVRKLFFFF